MSLNIHLQICDDTTVGIAHGIRTATRKIVRPLNFEFATKATVNPRIPSMVTEKKEKISVTQTACQKSLSEKIKR